MPSDYLPPDARADAPAPTPPPSTRLTNELSWALGLGVAGLGVLGIFDGAAFYLALPASIAGTILARLAQRQDARPDLVKVALLIGVVGVVLGVVAGVGYTVSWTR